MLIDTHTHLYAYDEAELPRVIEEARRTGVGVIVSSSDHEEYAQALATSRRTIQIAERFEGVYATVGLHPWTATRPITGEQIAGLREVAGSSKKIIAVGEAGLDYQPAYDYADPGREHRRWVFGEHLRLARELNLPVVVHARRAYEDTVRLVAEEKAAGLGVLLHGFRDGVDEAQQAAAMGLYFSFGLFCLREEGAYLEEVMRALPLNCIVLESDAPFVPRPGATRSEPGEIALVAERIAQARGVPVAEVERATTENAQRLYRL